MISLDSITALPEQTTLANGIRVFFRKTAGSGLASIQAWITTGSIHEEQYLGGGLSHYLEHMVFKATEKYSGEALTQKIQSAGGYVNAYTSFERTVYHIDIPAEKAETAFDGISQLTLHPALNAEDAKSEQDVIFREIDMGADDPDRKLSEASFAEVYRVHPYRLPVIGHREVFAQMDIAKLQDYFNRRYTTETIHIVIAGDIERDVAFALAEKYFGDAKRKPCPAPLVPEEPKQLARREIKLEGDVNVLRGNMIWKIPGIAHEDMPALNVLTAILGNGDSAILHRELHEELELVHEIDASLWAPGKQGLLWVSYLADCGRQAKIENALKKIIDKIADEGVPEKLIKKVSKRSLVDIVDSRKTVSRTASRLGMETVVLGDPGVTKLFVEKISAITSEDISRVAQKYFRDERMTVATFGKKAASSTSASNTKEPQPQQASLEDFEQFTLANGIRILLQREHNFPKVHLRAMLLAGGAFEDPCSRGASSILATMLTMDTENRSAAETAELIESVGGTFDDYAGTNLLTLSIETLAEDIDTAREILRDAVICPKFTQKNFRLERDTQLAALNADMDEITLFARDKLLERFFGKQHFIGTNNYGSEKTLAEMKLADIRALRKKVVVPQNLVISVSGDFDRDALLSKLTKDFENMKSPRGAKLIPQNEKTSTAERGNAKPVFVERKAEQTIVMLAFPCAGFADERAIVADTLQAIFNSMASRLFSEIREKRGLAYFVSSSRAGTQRESVFYLYAGTQSKHAEKVLSEMRKEITRIRAGKITEDELAAAKTRLSVNRRTAAQSPDSRAWIAGQNALFGLQINREKDLEKRYNALTIDDIMIFANEFFRDESALAMIVGSAR